MTEIAFPRLAARDLDGREVELPAGLPGEWNVVIVAFRRQQQDLADSWAPWLRERATCHTTPANVRAVHITGPYRWHRPIGARLSLADHGLTFGTTAERGVCLLLREPAPGIDPFGAIHHPGLTLTVADPRRFAATVREFAGLPPDAGVGP